MLQPGNDHEGVGALRQRDHHLEHEALEPADRRQVLLFCPVRTALPLPSAERAPVVRCRPALVAGGESPLGHQIDQQPGEASGRVDVHAHRVREGGRAGGSGMCGGGGALGLVLHIQSAQELIDRAVRLSEDLGLAIREKEELLGADLLLHLKHRLRIDLIVLLLQVAAALVHSRDQVVLARAQGDP